MPLRRSGMERIPFSTDIALRWSARHENIHITCYCRARILCREGWELGFAMSIFLNGSSEAKSLMERGC